VQRDEHRESCNRICDVCHRKSGCNDFDTSSFSDGFDSIMNWIVSYPRRLRFESEMIYSSLKLLFKSIFD
jgi:hypothetical protein